jgi:di/tricarboxylate transporter
MSIGIVTGILCIALFFLATEKIPVDLTAMGIVVSLMVTGVLTPKEAVAGFANPAVITVAAMFLISRALIRTGAVGFIAQQVVAYSRGNARMAMLMVLVIVAIASAFINNTPVVVLFIPIILTLSCEYGLSPSKLLIPVSYASILAGTCTLIGTSTNIIVSDLSTLAGYGQIGMFELARLGVPIAIAGIAFLYVAAPRLMPEHAAATCELDDRKNRRYLAELSVTQTSALIGQEPRNAITERYPSFEIFEISRKDHIFYPERDSVVLAAEDRILVKGSANDLVAILHEDWVSLPHLEGASGFGDQASDPLIVELIIPPLSSFLGERLIESDLHTDPTIQIIGMKRREMHYTAQKTENVKLAVGDILLVRCPRAKIAQIRASTELILVEDVHHEIIHKRKSRWALTIFAAVVIGATSGFADIMVCALTGVLFMILTGCIQLRDAYRALQADVLLIIVGTIALGAAMQKTGTSLWFAKMFLGLFGNAGPVWVLAGVLLLTSIGTQFLSNNATAVLLIPIAISTALTLGVSPRPFIVAVCFGASACFASPIGYQTNLLVYGPGSYRFADYMKLGIPLNLLVIAMGAIFIPVFWPF